MCVVSFQFTYVMNHGNIDDNDDDDDDGGGCGGGGGSKIISNISDLIGTLGQGL